VVTDQPDTSHWVCGLLDQASAQLLALEQAGLFPSQMAVGSATYASFRALRRRDLERGLPLFVLGVEVTEDPALAGEEFGLRPLSSAGRRRRGRPI
jgi:hypothetical protein